MAVKNRELLPRSADSADKTIRKLLPAQKDQYIHDSQVPGLVLRIPPAGSKLWHLRYQTQIGLTQKLGRKYTFGAFDEGMTTRKARGVAEDWRVRIRQGQDPLEEKRRRVVQGFQSIFRLSGRLIGTGRPSDLPS